MSPYQLQYIFCAERKEKLFKYNKYKWGWSIHVDKPDTT